MKLKLFDIPIDIWGVDVFPDNLLEKSGKTIEVETIVSTKEGGRSYISTRMSYIPYIGWAYVREGRTCCQDREYGCAYLGNCNAVSPKIRTILGVILP